MIVKFTVEIELGNDAMQSTADVGAAITYALGKAAGVGNLFEPLVLGDGGSIADFNGNTVGRWEVVA